MNLNTIKKLLLINFKKNWALIKLYRVLNCKTILFKDYKFNYYLTSEIQKNLHKFDLKLIGNLTQSPLLHSDKLEYFKNSLSEEAATTTEITREMFKSGRNPRNEPKQMIISNLRAIQFINENSSNTLNFNLILDLHQIMTTNTKAEDCTGNFRKKDVFIVDHINGEMAHSLPNYTEIESLMKELCTFINSEEIFIHPIIKSSILHFMIVSYMHFLMEMVEQPELYFISIC